MQVCARPHPCPQLYVCRQETRLAVAGDAGGLGSELQEAAVVEEDTGPAAAAEEEELTPEERARLLQTHGLKVTLKAGEAGGAKKSGASKAGSAAGSGAGRGRGRGAAKK